MIDAKVWTTILDTHKDSRYGYVDMDCQTYFSHVGTLILEIACLQKERRLLLAEVNRLRDEQSPPLTHTHELPPEENAPC